MFTSLRKSLFASAAAVLVLVGAGCGSLSAFGGVTETQYYNDLISQTNSLNSQIGIMADAYAAVQDGSNADKASRYSGSAMNDTMADTARSVTIDREASVDIDEGVRAEVDALAAQYFDLTNQAGGVMAQLADYSESESYKDDKGKQFKQMEKELKTALEELEPVQQELADLIEEKQDGIDLGIEEGSTDPLDVATLATDTLSSDAEDAQDAALAWLDAYLDSGTAGSTDDMQVAFDTLSQDYTTYEQRAKDAGVSNLTFSGSRFESYMGSMNDYINEYEATIRRINNGELEGIESNIGDDSIIEDGLASQYNNSIVRDHNSIINSLQSDARTSY
jgi:hypothetical protein